MAVEAIKSSAITTADAVPPTPNQVPVRKANGRLRESIGVAAVDAAASIASTYRLLRVHSSWRLTNLLLSCTAITSAAGDIGLYDVPTVNSGAVVDVDLFASAQTLAAALANTDVMRESNTITIANLEKPLWEILGLSADPGKYYDVAITLTAAATAAGTLGLRTQFVAND